MSADVAFESDAKRRDEHEGPRKRADSTGQPLLVRAAHVDASDLEDEAAFAHALALSRSAGMHLRDEDASTGRVAQAKPERPRTKLEASGRYTRTGRSRSRRLSRPRSHRFQPLRGIGDPRRQW